MSMRIHTYMKFIIVFLTVKYRDGMIKRAGNESYLHKIVEEERKAYCEVLELSGNESASQTDSNDEDTDSEQ